MDTQTTRQENGLEARPFALNQPEELVELSLLVSKNRMELLLELAKKRNRTLGQLLRDLIERELAVAAVR